MRGRRFSLELNNSRRGRLVTLAPTIQHVLQRVHLEGTDEESGRRVKKIVVPEQYIVDGQRHHTATAIKYPDCDHVAGWL